MVYSVILAPLPYPDADRLVFVWEKLPNMPDPPGGRLQFARKNYLDGESKISRSTGMGRRFQEEQLNETTADQARQIGVGSASSDLFPAARSASPIRATLSSRRRTCGSRPRHRSDGGYFKKHLHSDPNV
jgi:hypothetical protein